MRRFRVVNLLWVLLVTVIAAGQAWGQGTDLGTIRGNVTDTSGAVIPNARVVVTDLATNATRETKTNSAGDYEVFGVNAGRYRVDVSAPGLDTEEIANLAVSGSETVTADAKLQVSRTQQTVVVAADNTPVHTEDQTISSSLNNQAVIELPRDSRDIYSFLYLNPNITQGDEPGDFKFLGFQSYGASFSLDGQRSNGGIFGQATSSEPSLEAVGELNILSNDFSAEYSGIATIRVTTKRGTDQYHGSLFYNNRNSALAAWPLQDKIAEASFAPTAFQSKYPTPFFNVNDAGASFGGPVPLLRKNTWFFMAYEHNSTVEPDTVESDDLPHPSLLAGNFALVDDSIKPAVPSSITLTPQEIATDTVGGMGQQFIQIPQRLLNPSVQALIAKYFTPIGTSAPIDPTTGRVPGYVNLVSAASFQDLGTLRLDHDFSEKDHVFVTYNTSALSSSGEPAEDNAPNTGFVGEPYSGLGLLQTDRRNNAVAASYTKIVKPNMVNELRGGFNIQDLFTHSNTTLGGFLSSIGFSQDQVAAYGVVVGSKELSTYGQPAISFGGAFATFPNGKRSTDRPENQNLQTFGDTFNWVLGKHNLKMGADFVRNEAIDGFVENRGNVRGLMTYSGTGTTPLADWLIGLPPTSVSYVGSVRPPLNVHNWETGYFFQDDWKVTSHLTLNFGVRYELITPFIEANDLLANFDPNMIDPVTGQPGVFVLPSTRTLQYIDPRIVSYGYVLASQAHVGRGLVNPDTNNIAPRIGFAWRLGEKTVLRGGWGVYYPTSAAQGIRDPMASAPFNPGVTYRATDSAPLGGWPGNPEGGTLMSGGVIRGAGNVPTANAVPFNLQQPRIQQYNFTFERDLGWSTALRLSYLGTAMHGLIAGKDLDEIAPSNNPFGTTVGDGATPCDPVNLGNCALSSQDLARLPFPGLQEFVLTYGNFGHGLTNAFQTQIEHRFTNHLMFSAAYTYMSENSTAVDTGNSSLGGVAYDIFDPNSDYGPEAFVSKNRFVAYGIYDLPVGRGRSFGSSMPKWLDAFVGGWQSTFNMFAKSGTGFTPFWICDDCDPVEPGNVAVGSVDPVGDFNCEPCFRPVVLTNTYNQRNGDYMWNDNAFGPPPAGADLFSNPNVATRNMLWGPGTWGLNLGAHKFFSFGERVKAELGADIDNLFNHPLLSPDLNYGGGGGPFAEVGDFNLQVNQTTGQLLPITQFNRNPLFGQLTNSFSQEGIDSRRAVRLRLRITF
jgi:hypothetical protein